MKVKIAPEGLDLTAFKALFYRNINTDQSVYDLYIGDIMVCIETTTLKQSQLITVGFFKTLASNKDAQFFPLNDIRFQNLSIVQDIFGATKTAWGHIPFTTVDQTYDLIRRLLSAVYKVNKLKAFL
jgi:hypothetical protein